MTVSPAKEFEKKRFFIQSTCVKAIDLVSVERTQQPDGNWIVALPKLISKARDSLELQVAISIIATGETPTPDKIFQAINGDLIAKGKTKVTPKDFGVGEGRQSSPK